MQTHKLPKHTLHDYKLHSCTCVSKHRHAGSSHYIATFCLSSVVPHTGSFTDINTNRLSNYGLHYSYWWGYIYNQNQHGILNSECQWENVFRGDKLWLYDYTKRRARVFNAWKSGCSKTSRDLSRYIKYYLSLTFPCIGDRCHSLRT